MCRISTGRRTTWFIRTLARWHSLVSCRIFHCSNSVRKTGSVRKKSRFIVHNVHKGPNGTIKSSAKMEINPKEVSKNMLKSGPLSYSYMYLAGSHYDLQGPQILLPLWVPLSLSNVCAYLYWHSCKWIKYIKLLYIKYIFKIIQAVWILYSLLFYIFYIHYNSLLSSLFFLCFLKLNFKNFHGFGKSLLVLHTELKVSDIECVPDVYIHLLMITYL